LAAHGLAQVELADVVRRRLKGGVVYPELRFEAYRERLRQCDLFLCPFPYGNMNSIIDAVSLGLPGVCHDGAEAHAHADAAIFARVGLPRELAASNVEQYVAAAVRLIDDGDWRRHCGDIARRCDVDAAFYRGNPDLFCQMMAKLASSGRGVTPPARPSLPRGEARDN
jgi:predicted O-linked N-acetylglucosamine transferase (SPINDLY family)